MNDLDAIKARHLDPTRSRGQTYYEGHIEVDLAACVAEVEQLRSDLDSVRAALGNGADEDAWPPGLTVPEAVARLRGEAARERNAAVAWLEMQSRIDGEVAAYAIETGAHRKGDEES